jgi:K+-sensing histidine kinase KdpD
MLCKTLAELHGGGIAVTSAKNHGSCFTVLLPASLTTATPHHLEAQGPADAMEKPLP